MEARMRAQIEHRRLEEFESIIRGKNKKTPEPKKRRKRPVKDPTPIVLSDWRSWVRIPTWALPFFFYPKKSYTEISVLVQREKKHTPASSYGPVSIFESFISLNFRKMMARLAMISLLGLVSAQAEEESIYVSFISPGFNFYFYEKIRISGSFDFWWIWPGMHRLLCLPTSTNVISIIRATKVSFFHWELKAKTFTLS